ncbi:Coenzyme F420 hydrogenase/dehydrogenase, beta subunit C-terminal domain [Archaeoglobus profundus]|uniref:Coenzyme F420 hydrogenase/dehydrogenase beta subunit domain protein n=1 Tax=Archaeoglobus profundus (strain DSM 5631 / JCM 9629 / NBRC 100127 / Av18) TaxID=572546 RepID=D2REU1_ARCPA|nr:Coenzyme F420 hydrogenase/dehydrogenase, beta subunit C-terminal domain [Archaeoglobus profundus]ADB58635.1 coenzyme F420 hydrogenase/dehydrogenase beta subunit domain protein [Archaeoglobus profundus DSM 5631]
MNPFEELEVDIILSGKCCYCGACGAFCKYIHYENERPVAENCEHCGVCYDVCPVNYFSESKAEIEIFGEKRKDDAIGYYREILAGRATDENIRSKAQDGGAVTAILTYLLESGAIDSAVVTGRDESWNPKPIVAISKEDLLASTGSKYTQCLVLLGVKDAIKMGKKSIALVGLPCHVKAIRNAQMSGHSLGAEKVSVVLGLFCMETFSRDLLKHKLEEIGVKIEDVEKFDIKKGKLMAWVKGEVKTIPLKELKDAVRTSCKFCNDFTAEFADISFGSVGSDDGWSTIIIRSDRGEKIVKGAVDQGYLEVQPITEKGIEAIRKLASRKKSCKVVYTQI